MSRTNHYYLCQDCRSEHDRCERHPMFTKVRGCFTLSGRQCWEVADEADKVRFWYWRREKRVRPICFIDGRRPWRRRRRWPTFGRSAHHSPPPRWWWHEQHARARRVQDREIYRAAADDFESLSITNERRLINLRGWY